MGRVRERLADRGLRRARQALTTGDLAARLVLAQTTVAGGWYLEMLWPGGKSTGSCTFTIEGDRLGGTCGGDERFPITGRVIGRKVTWQMDVKQGGAQGRMEFDGEVDEPGTTIKGSCNIGDQFGSFTMKKE